MLDQSFSARNFRRIFDYENRKGVYLEGRFFPRVEFFSKELKACAAEQRELRARKDTLTDTEFQEQLALLSEKRDRLKDGKESLLMESLELVSNAVSDKTFAPEVQRGTFVHGKRVYVPDPSPAAYFALKQLQYNIRRLYKVQQSNRHDIVCQLIVLLADKFPKYVLRADFSRFYENIRQQQLFRFIAEDGLLTIRSQQLVKGTLKAYNRLAGSHDGLPRGIGLSAYLSELYMRRFDNSVASFPNVLYYARYVDDVFAIYIPPPNASPAVFDTHFDDVAARYELSLNPAKTIRTFLPGDSSISVDYLGYRLSFGDGAVKVAMTQRKISRYKLKMECAFRSYSNSPRGQRRRARSLLLKRLRFLTGNTRLVNNKRNAAVGIYFSNSLLTSKEDLQTLDNHLATLVENGSADVRANASTLSFTKGFTERRYQRYTAQELASIVKAWRYAKEDSASV